MDTVSGSGVVFDGTNRDDDVLVLGNDTNVRGARGDDWLTAFLNVADDEIASVSMSGDSGNDRLHATLQSEESLSQVTLNGGTGDDFLWAEFYDHDSDESASLSGGDGNDEIRVSHGYLDSGDSMPAKSIAADVDGGDGSDEISVVLWNGGDFPTGGEDRLVNGAFASINGGNGGDKINSDVWSGGGPASNVIFAGAGNDTVAASAGYSSDFLGGSAHVEVHGGEGDDDLTAKGNGLAPTVEARGDDGDDTINVSGSSGTMDIDAEASTSAYGGDGADRITAKLSFSVYYTDAGQGVGTNYVEGGDGEDRLSASITGRDGTEINAHSELYGGDGADRLSVRGGEGNILNGGTGADTLLGSAGADTLIGLGGDDYLRGRGGDDVFLFGAIRNGERDRVVDFTSGEDRIDLSQIDANVNRSGNQSFTFGTREGTGRAWVEQGNGSSSLLHADTGGRELVVVLEDGRDVGPGDYSASDFIL